MRNPIRTLKNDESGLYAVGSLHDASPTAILGGSNMQQLLTESKQDDTKDKSNLKQIVQMVSKTRKTQNAETQKKLKIEISFKRREQNHNFKMDLKTELTQ